LAPLAREVLVLRHLEGLSIAEVAAALGIGVAAAKKRYVRVGELALDLQRFLEDQPIRARRPTLLDRAAKWVRRHRAAAASAAATVVILLVTTAAAGLLVATKQRPRRDLAVAAREREAAWRRHAEDLAEQGRQRLVQLNVGEVRAWQLDHGLATPDLDLLNASVALAHGLTHVTHNTQDYAYIPGLTLADWLAP
jgi:predicted nucleic acid-binding protein